MALTGIGSDPTPAIRREIIFAQGDSLGVGSARIVILIGNKTTAGSETVETLTTQILGDQDMRDRFGARSELYQMWRTYSYIDTNATIYAYPVTEAGAASTFTLTFAGGAATDTTTMDITWGGLSTSFSVASGDTAIVQAAAYAAAAVYSAEPAHRCRQRARVGENLADLVCARSIAKYGVIAVGDVMFNRADIDYCIEKCGKVQLQIGCSAHVICSLSYGWNAAGYESASTMPTPALLVVISMLMLAAVI